MFAVAEFVEFFTAQEFYNNARRLCKGENFLRGTVERALGEKNFVDAATGLQQLGDGVAPVN